MKPTKDRKKSSLRRHEVTDPNPMTLPVKFKKPPTLAEQIARYMGDHERFNEGDGSDEDDFEVAEDESPESPHELVYDPLLNRELPRYEKILLDRGRAEFDAKLLQKMKDDKASAAAVALAKEQIDAERRNAKKSKRAPALNEESDDSDE